MTNVLDINEDQFVDEVIEKSKTIPVIVDFWAPWCGPCKQLTPTLEKVVNKKNGKIILAKINVDENQGIASQLNIQSIPTVYGFVDGKPIDAFQGAQPESKVEIMVDKMIDATPGNEIPKLIDEADQLLKDQKFDESLALFEKLVGMDPGNPKIIAGLLRCLIQLKRFEDAEEMFESFDDSILGNEEILKIKKLLDSSNKTNNDISYEKLVEEVKINPQDKNLRFNLAVSYLSGSEIKKGFDELLKIFEQDPNWNEGAAKRKLLEFFDLLGFNDPNVADARKKLSSLMFK
ncbi:MAG: thioredoxin [Candidatus Pelagibacter sp. TMED202]|nr:MAG: thioredoxin [Candidatus Pelagibacter sp. TMED202]|tara:strand:- start:1706 stop:2575 length:870 start_codon:yes stop_codon:yes gene_type:complete